jgi:transcriptional regulator
MPRKLDPAFIEEVRALAAKGYSQTQIASKLRTNQPRISYIMRHHTIPTENYATVRRHVLTAAAIDMRIHVHVTSGDGKTTMKEVHDGTPEQLEAIAAYVRGVREQVQALMENGRTLGGKIIL